jgi:signal transduction histidine kinase
VTAHRRTWAWFAGAAFVLLGATSWLTATLVALDRDEVSARRSAELQQKLRLALWRMDSWLAPHLAREAMRPADEYRSFAPIDSAWTVRLDKLQEGVVVPSPLLTFTSELFPLHFELEADGSLASPQVPPDAVRDRAMAGGLSAEHAARAATRLQELRPRLLFAGFDTQLRAAEALLPDVGCNPAPAGAGAELQQSVAEYSNRQIANAESIGQIAKGARARSRAQAPVVPAVPSSLGPLLPFWLADGEVLVFARRAQRAGGQSLQGVLVDWPVLQRELMLLVDDLFGGGTVHVVRCERPSAVEQASMLASVPARLVVDAGYGAAISGLPTTPMLVVTWAVTLLGLLALGFTLRTAIGYGERRARFASAVTHELRTPLTTFRMYSEMLADGVVTDPAAQREYLGTLRQEADRLSRVVENVLAWSRLEQGRFASRRERHALAAILQRVEPQLQRRLQDAGMRLELRLQPTAAEVVLRTDEDAIGQILFNLVDNAAKYARGAADPVVVLAAAAGDGRVCIDVCDRGPGVPPALRERVFQPFDRGAVPTATNDTPGVGLGLALARGLARDLGGELALVADAAPGARFRLELPLA